MPPPEITLHCCTAICGQNHLNLSDSSGYLSLARSRFRREAIEVVSALHLGCFCLEALEHTGSLLISMTGSC